MVFNKRKYRKLVVLSCNLRHFGGAFPVASVAHASTATLAMGVTPLPLRNTIATFFRQAKSTHNFPPPSPWGWVTFLPWRHGTYTRCISRILLEALVFYNRCRRRTSTSTLRYATLRYATLHADGGARPGEVARRGRDYAHRRNPLLLLLVVVVYVVIRKKCQRVCVKGVAGNEQVT